MDSPNAVRPMEKDFDILWSVVMHIQRITIPILQMWDKSEKKRWHQDPSCKVFHNLIRVNVTFGYRFTINFGRINFIWWFKAVDTNIEIYHPNKKVHHLVPILLYGVLTSLIKFLILLIITLPRVLITILPVLILQLLSHSPVTLKLVLWVVVVFEALDSLRNRCPIIHTIQRRWLESIISHSWWSFQFLWFL